MKGLLIAIPLLLLAAPLASAQTDLPDPGMLPDSAFYGLKRFFEGIGTAFTFGDEARAMRALELAELRMAETRAVVEMGRPEFVEGLVADYDKEIENSNRSIASISDEEKKKAVSERVALATSRHLDVLDSVEEKVPQQARLSIAAAKETSMKGNMEALRALAAEDPEKAAEMAMQVAQGRAEKAREAAERGDDMAAVEAAEQYAEYERFGVEISSIAQQVGKDPSKVDELVAKARSIHITVLEEVKGKVPDDAAKSIDEALAESQGKERVESAGDAADDTREQDSEEVDEVQESESEEQEEESESEDERGPPSEVPSGRP